MSSQRSLKISERDITDGGCHGRNPNAESLRSARFCHGLWNQVCISNQNDKLNYQNKRGEKNVKRFHSSANMYYVFSSFPVITAALKDSKRRAAVGVFSIFLGATFICSTDAVHKSDNMETQTGRGEHSICNIAAFLLKVFEHEISWVYHIGTLFQAGEAVIHREGTVPTHTHTHCVDIEWVRTQCKVILGYSALCRNVIMSLPI